MLAKLDRPRVMIHHLRDLPQALPHVPPGTDFLMGYPPTLGELRHYLRSRPARGEPRHKLRINVDGIELLRALDRLSKHTPRKLPIDVVLEIYNGIPRGGFDPGAELTEALKVLRAARGRLRLSALLCYDALAAGASDDPTRQDRSQVRAGQPRTGLPDHRPPGARPGRSEDVRPKRARILQLPYWGGTTAANEFSAGSAVLFANYLDPYDISAGLAKGAVPVRARAAAA